MPWVRGFVELPMPAESLRSARIRVRVEDVSRVDDRARILGEFILDGVPAQRLSGDRLGFEVAIAGPDEGASLAVRVHIDLDGDDAVSVDDYVSTEHVAVRPEADPTDVLVKVRRVGRRT
jgi:hypothetical protein